MLVGNSPYVQPAYRFYPVQRFTFSGLHSNITEDYVFLSSPVQFKDLSEMQPDGNGTLETGPVQQNRIQYMPILKKESIR
jgi:hypothetical protein